jgi:hypothetical protein
MILSPGSQTSGFGNPVIEKKVIYLENFFIAAISNLLYFWATDVGSH